ncbi:hypothetical protein GQ55_8G178700 [Panicum hallii var. hallii]|uniref:Uncharacterized protein n=1 Tax=Panicum hallii var. hallii TaxID=1504633 RepID=A0A2T7CNK8_9POAL|nr:hypothetical protein GQ55_8G178700 [Panicum hallii var. hallii]
MPRRDDSARTPAGRTMEPRVKDVGDCCGAKAAVRRDELGGASMQPNTTVTSYSRWNSPSPPMADVRRIYWDAEGYAHTDCLYWEWFPRILWDTLRIYHYPDPPQNKGREFTEVGVPRCRATVTIPHHPTLEWQSIEIEVVGCHLVDAFEAAALKAITTFCEQHPNAVAAYPIGLFPAFFAHDAEWIFRTTYLEHLVGDIAKETLREVIRYMNTQYRLQSLKQKCMDDMVNLAQDFHRDLTLKDDQIHSLGQEIVGRDTTIGHLEVQILESDAQILQRTTIIDFL